MRSVSRGASRQGSKGRVVLSLISLFVLSFLMFFIFLFELRSSDGEDGSLGDTGAAKDKALDKGRVVPPMEEVVKRPRIWSAEMPAGYSPAIIMLTSLNGVDRSKERLAVLEALCSNENLELMKRYGFKVYVSVDSLSGDTDGFHLPPCGPLAITLWHHKSNSEGGFPGTPTGRVATHYKFATRQAFASNSHAIFLEDDLVPASDFISLFVPGSPAFDAFQAEPSRVWCISAWNDMGVSSHASDTTRLFRTDFFPGLGWMTSKDIFMSAIRSKWPDRATTGWDNWLRSNNDQDRQCIVPEVNRVKHISRIGVNVEDPLNVRYGVFSFPPSSIRYTDWTLEGGSNTAKYEQILQRRLKKAARVDYFRHNSVDAKVFSGDVLVIYSRGSLARLLSDIGAYPPMLEPRAGYKGAIAFRKSRDTFIYLCDLVHCAHEWLFPSESLVKPSALVVSAQRHVSCTKTCEEHKLACDELNLQTISTPPGRACILLRTHFNCIAGCGHQVGEELPALVVARDGDTAGQCLAGESAVPKCDASHTSTRRLCSCVKP